MYLNMIVSWTGDHVRCLLLVRTSCRTSRAISGWSTSVRSVEYTASRKSGYETRERIFDQQSTRAHVASSAIRCEHCQSGALACIPTPTTACSARTSRAVSLEMRGSPHGAAGRAITVVTAGTGMPPQRAHMPRHGQRSQAEPGGPYTHAHFLPPRMRLLHLLAVRGLRRASEAPLIAAHDSRVGGYHEGKGTAHRA